MRLFKRIDQGGRPSLGSLPWVSLKTRVTLFTLAIVVISIWSVAFYATEMLHDDMLAQLSEQQYATVSLLAEDINEEIGNRLKALKTEGAIVGRVMATNEAAIQGMLERRPMFASLFNGGVIAMRRDGTTIADIPLSAGRLGVKYMDRDYIAAALNQGKSGVGHPGRGKKLAGPLVTMAAPILDRDGKVVGALAGTTDLTRPSFLDKITRSRYGKTGEFVVVARDMRQIVAGTNASRVMEVLPAPGINPTIDRVMRGDRVSSIFVNPRGVEVLGAAANIPSANWYIAANLPTEEAFAPIRTMRQRMLLATILFTLLAGSLSWWLTWLMLRRRLSPLLAATQALDSMNELAWSPQPLPITRPDEVGDLIGGFNRLLQALGEREELLRESEAHTRAIAQSAHDAIITSDSEGTIVSWNHGAEVIFGYSESEAMGQTTAMLMPQQYRDSHIAGVQHIAAGGEPKTVGKPVDLHGLRKNGSEFPLEISLSKWQTTKGWFVTGIIRDITERKRYEDALKENQGKLQLFIDHSPAALAMFDRDMRYISAGRRWLIDYGLTGRDLRGLSHYAVFPEIAEPWREIHRRALTGEVLRAEMDRFERADGTVQWLRWEARPWYESETVIGGIVIFSEDLTERRRLEEAHLQAQNLESLGRLAGGISHDFNNILAAIQGNAYLASRDVGQDHAAAESLEEIRKACNRAAELVRRIMAFGSPKEARLEVLDLSATVSEVLKLLRSTLPAGIVLKTTFADETPHVLADAGQIHEAVVNLTTNAAYAIGPRAGAIDYRLEPIQVEEDLARRTPGLKEGPYARLTVTDSGSGMDTSTLERIFDAFYTTKPLGEGTGLGLSMVHGTMKSHGGAVTAQSVRGKGSTFALYFPAAGDRVVKQGDNVAAQVLVAAGQRVLYVDDEEALVFLASRVLSRLGHKVTSFTDPEQALEVFRAHPNDFDLMVTDLAMPRLSGLSLAREVLAVRPEMPVLMTTGYISASDEQVAREAGIRELILKPVTPERLGRVLNDYSVLRKMGGDDTVSFVVDRP